MSNITSLGAPGSEQPQVIALDSRKPEQVVSDKQYLKILQLSDLLSRHLNLEDILKVFSHVSPDHPADGSGRVDTVSQRTLRQQ